MPKLVTKSRKRPASGPKSATAPTRSVGRPAREAGRARRQIVVDTALLAEAMRLTGQGQSDTINAALARMTENAFILEGINQIFGAYPDHPNHESEDEGADGGR